MSNFNIANFEKLERFLIATLVITNCFIFEIFSLAEIKLDSKTTIYKILKTVQSINVFSSEILKFRVIKFGMHQLQTLFMNFIICNHRQSKF